MGGRGALMSGRPAAGFVLAALLAGVGNAVLTDNGCYCASVKSTTTTPNASTTFALGCVAANNTRLCLIEAAGVPGACSNVATSTFTPRLVAGVGWADNCTQARVTPMVAPLTGSNLLEWDQGRYTFYTGQALTLTWTSSNRVVSSDNASFTMLVGATARTITPAGGVPTGLGATGGWTWLVASGTTYVGTNMPITMAVLGNAAVTSLADANITVIASAINTMVVTRAGASIPLNTTYGVSVGSDIGVSFRLLGTAQLATNVTLQLRRGVTNVGTAVSVPVRGGNMTGVILSVPSTATLGTNYAVVISVPFPNSTTTTISGTTATFAVIAAVPTSSATASSTGSASASASATITASTPSATGSASASASASSSSYATRSASASSMATYSATPSASASASASGSASASALPTSTASGSASASATATASASAAPCNDAAYKPGYPGYDESKCTYAVPSITVSIVLPVLTRALMTPASNTEVEAVRLAKLDALALALVRTAEGTVGYVYSTQPGFRALDYVNFSYTPPAGARSLVEEGAAAVAVAQARALQATQVGTGSADVVVLLPADSSALGPGLTGSAVVPGESVAYNAALRLSVLFNTKSWQAPSTVVDARYVLLLSLSNATGIDSRDFIDRMGVQISPGSAGNAVLRAALDRAVSAGAGSNADTGPTLPIPILYIYIIAGAGGAIVLLTSACCVWRCCVRCKCCRKCCKCCRRRKIRKMTRRRRGSDDEDGGYEDEDEEGYGSDEDYDDDEKRWEDDEDEDKDEEEDAAAKWEKEAQQAKAERPRAADGKPMLPLGRAASKKELVLAKAAAEATTPVAAGSHVSVSVSVSSASTSGFIATNPMAMAAALNGSAIASINAGSGSSGDGSLPVVMLSNPLGAARAAPPPGAKAAAGAAALGATGAAVDLQVSTTSTTTVSGTGMATATVTEKRSESHRSGRGRKTADPEDDGSAGSGTSDDQEDGDGQDTPSEQATPAAQWQSVRVPLGRGPSRKSLIPGTSVRPVTPSAAGAGAEPAAYTPTAVSS